MSQSLGILENAIINWTSVCQKSNWHNLGGNMLACSPFLLLFFIFFHFSSWLQIWTESDFKFLSGFCGIFYIVICLTSLHDCEISKPQFVLAAAMKTQRIAVPHYPFNGCSTTPTCGLWLGRELYALAEFLADIIADQVWEFGEKET